MAPKSSELVFDFHVAFVEATEFERSKADGADPVVDLLEAHLIAHAHNAHTHPSPVPSDTVIDADGRCACGHLGR